jgi:hypothetical protein
MQGNVENFIGASCKEKHQAPAGNDNTIFMNESYLRISFINLPDQFLILKPATKMNNGKQNKKTPEIPEQASQHDGCKNKRSECPPPKNCYVQRHAERLSLKVSEKIFNEPKKYYAMN